MGEEEEEEDYNDVEFPDDEDEDEDDMDAMRDSIIEQIFRLLIVVLFLRFRESFCIAHGVHVIFILVLVVWKFNVVVILFLLFSIRVIWKFHIVTNNIIIVRCTALPLSVLTLLRVL